MSLHEVYRYVLLGELVVFEFAYLWSAVRYLRQVFVWQDPALRSVRMGVFDRTIGIALLLALFIGAIIGRHGFLARGPLYFNLWLQIILVFWGAAWIRVDRKRFLTIEKELERSEAALSALERVEAAQRRQENKARARRRDMRPREGT